MNYLANQNNTLENNILNSSPIINDPHLKNKRKSNEHLKLKNRNLINTNNSNINNESTRDPSINKNKLNSKCNNSNLYDHCIENEEEKCKVSKLINENCSKNELTEHEKHYANYKKNFVLSKIKNFNTLKNTDDDINNDLINYTEENNCKNKFFNSYNTHFYEHTRHLKDNNTLLSHKNISNFSTIELNTDRTIEKKLDNKYKLETIDNLSQFENGENKKKHFNKDFDNYYNSNPSSSNNKNQIINKVKKQLSKYNYDKIFDALNLKNSKKKELITSNDIFILKDTSINKIKNINGYENRINDNKNKYKTNFSINKNSDAYNEFSNNSNFVENKIKNKSSEKSSLLFSDFYECKMEEFDRLNVKKIDKEKTKLKDM